MGAIQKVSQWNNNKIIGKKTEKEYEHKIFNKINSDKITTNRLRARNTFAPPGGIFQTMFFLKAQCLASILVGWLQLASEAFVCYLAVKYVTIQINIYFLNSLKIKILSLDIKYMMFFGVNVQEGL